MRTLITLITATAVLATGSLWAQETDPARQIAEAWQAEQEMRAEHEERLNELMTVMAEEMEAIHEAGNQTERQQLLAEHRDHMHEAMDLMRDLGGSHMRDVTKQHLGPHSKMHQSSEMAGSMMQGLPRQHMSDSTHLDDLETRVDMMQIMLESMLAEDVGS